MQRSINGKDFEKIGFVQGAGTSTVMHSYEFHDANIESSIYYYRLKQIDFNNDFEFSKTIAVRRTNENNSGVELVYPNPFGESIDIIVNKDFENPPSISLFDITGRKVFVKNISPTDYSIHIDLTPLVYLREPISCQ